MLLRTEKLFAGFIKQPTQNNQRLSQLKLVEVVIHRNLFSRESEDKLRGLRRGAFINYVAACQHFSEASIDMA